MHIYTPLVIYQQFYDDKVAILTIFDMQFAVCHSDSGIFLQAAISFGSERRWGSWWARHCCGCFMAKNPPGENSQLSGGNSLPFPSLILCFCHNKENVLLIGKNLACLPLGFFMDLRRSLGLISNHKSCSQLNVEHSYLVMWHSRVLAIVLRRSLEVFPRHLLSLLLTLLSLRPGPGPPRLLWLIMLCFGHLIATWLWMWLLLWLMSNLW